ncbi:unnamed protein product [Schistosoma mattheei]|uniref:Uncharacterized protein n=1 Tax=Schistosoma mattheei TaxID=31246 RepID=A0A3P8GYR5_9TREM|nr:unnamed protein product [Schistosoma mattheei]
MRELVLPGRFDPVSPSFTVRDVTTELSGPRPGTLCFIIDNYTAYEMCTHSTHN